MLPTPSVLGAISGLRLAGRLESLQLPLPPSCLLVRILGPVVSALPLLMAGQETEVPPCAPYEPSLSVTNTSGAKPCFGVGPWRRTGSSFAIDPQAGLQKDEAHGQAPHPQRRVQASGRPGVPGGETLHGLSNRHDLSRNLIRIWVDKYGSDSISMTFSATSLFLIRNSAVASSTQDDLSDPRRSVGR